MEERARFPEVAAKAGHYESFYIKACEPGGGRGIWIRHTVHKRPGAEPNASIWFCFFDREAAAPRAAKVTVGADSLFAGTEKFQSDGKDWIYVGGSTIGPGHARGEVRSEALIASWELEFSGEAEPCKYLPADWLYEAPLPKTKFLAPYPDACFNGRLKLYSESIELSGWPGMIGHNWGSEHAERWVWLEGTGFPDAPDTYFDAGAARVRLGSRTSPWIPSGMLVLDGEAHRLGGLGAIRSARIEEQPTVCAFQFPGKDIIVHGRVSAPKKDFVGWVYADPKGPEHHTVNCSVADLELTVERPGLPPRQLTLAAAAAYELGMRETADQQKVHGIPIQPYSDG
jgi:hypothetical protein